MSDDNIFIYMVRDRDIGEVYLADEEEARELARMNGWKNFKQYDFSLWRFNKDPQAMLVQLLNREGFC